MKFLWNLALILTIAFDLLSILAGILSIKEQNNALSRIVLTFIIMNLWFLLLHF